MGQGYFILLWDSWGSGLVRVNARFHSEGVDLYGNPKNWWPCDEGDSDEEIMERHKIPADTFVKLIRD